MYRGKEDVMTSELLRAFSYESYAHTHNYMFSSRLSDKTLNVTTHFQPKISHAASELRNSATRLRNTKH